VSLEAVSYLRDTANYWQKQALTARRHNLLNLAAACEAKAEVLHAVAGQIALGNHLRTGMNQQS
jgi:hypothetical protein